MEIASNSREETLRLGETIGAELKPGDIVLLFGDLGSGKTTLTQGISNGLGLKKGEYIRSPTFTIINEYEGRCPIYHMDLFRVETFAEAQNLGLEEYFFGVGVVVVEWAEKLFAGKNPEKSIGFGIESRVEIRISMSGDDRRFFDIRCVNREDGGSLLFALQ
ncbi:MAG: tRNA (adenosine(37)-N6)-threonylcarbamoyltransferase complex ATPase subunit type 1 TsaE [Nitrospinales bacterium]